MDLDSTEVGWLANHLAHDPNTHKSFYRKHDATLELAKVSKLLLVAEKGELGRFAGKKLDDISIDGKLL